MEPTTVWLAVPLRINWTILPPFPIYLTTGSSRITLLYPCVAPLTPWIQPRWWISISLNNLSSCPHCEFPTALMTGRLQTYECILMNPLQRVACSIPPPRHGSTAPGAGTTLIFDRPGTLCYMLLPFSVPPCCILSKYIGCVFACVYGYVHFGWLCAFWMVTCVCVCVCVCV